MYIFPLALSLDFSCGPLAAMALDANHTIWIFESWGRPYQLISPLLDCSSPETTPIQIEQGLIFSAVLTRSGDVYVWSASMGGSEQYKEAMAKLDMDESTRAIVPDGGTVITCHTWEMEVDPVKLPIPPNLPDLPMTGLPEEEHRKEIKFIKIVAINFGFVGLTSKGHVCLFEIDSNQIITDQFSFVWSYVSDSAQMI